MKVTIIRGPHTDKNIFACYDYIVKKYREELLANSRSLLSSSDLDYNNPKERRGNDGSNGQAGSS